MKNFGDKAKKLPWKNIYIILTIVLFFSFCAILTYDSGHYLSYVSIFEGNSSASSWDIIRGPVFPLIIHSFNILFGKTNTGLLIGFFLFYILFVFLTYKTCLEITQHYKHKKLIQNILIFILVFNPLIFGYFHVLLTEFIAITLTMMNILLAYRWIFIDIKNKKTMILYPLYFIVSTIFCYHLKQPYIIIALTPLIITVIISIIRNKDKWNIIYRLSTFFASILFLISSIFLWNNILKAMETDNNPDRNPASALSNQLLLAYQITYDNDNDGKNDYVSTFEAIKIIFDHFTSNPLYITKIYLKNYCGLSSICEIATTNGASFYSTKKSAGLYTYENTFIGYATYREEENISPMPSEMAERASSYYSPPNKSIFANIMNNLTIPTNILFKFSIISPLPTLLILLAARVRDKKKLYNNLFYLNLLLLLVPLLHLSIEAGIGLIIDRYAVEAFVPSLIGLFGTATYIMLINRQAKNKKLPKRSRKS